METMVWCSGLVTEAAPALAQVVPRIGLHCVLCYLPAAAVPFIPWAARRLGGWAGSEDAQSAESR